jgi:hypothetical protein
MLSYGRDDFERRVRRLPSRLSGPTKESRHEDYITDADLVDFVYADQASTAPLRLSYSIVGPPVAAVWMTYETVSGCNTTRMSGV